MGAGREGEVNRRLVIRPGAIGDFIVSLPAIESLGAANLEVWTASAHVPLVRFTARARAIASTGLDLLGIATPDPRLIDTLGSFDSIVSWYGSNRPDFRALVESLRLPFHFLDALPPPGCTLHAVDFYLEQTASLRSQPSATVPRIPVPARNREGAVIHPFSGSQRKNWPLERYRELADKLSPTLPVKWCAGPEEYLPEAAIRTVNLYELACRLARVRVYIGNDSGIAHLAAAVGTPVVVLFGPTDPRVWAPRGDHVRVVQGMEMTAISVAEVLAATLK
jgi:ADP-heptose:LPS heptosyltransferase